MKKSTGKGMYLKPWPQTGQGLSFKKKRKRKHGRGLLNTLIDNLGWELHMPGGYNFCGPGTRLSEKLSKGVTGINKLDEACKQHDIFYSQNSDTAARNKADLELAERAWQRVKSSDASLGEKAAAWAITNAMKAKAKLGMGINKKYYDYDKFPAVKASTRGAPLQRRIHAKRTKKSKGKKK